MNLRKTLVLLTDTQPGITFHLIDFFSRKYGTWIPLLKVKTIFTWCMSKSLIDMRIFMYKITVILFPWSGSLFVKAVKFEEFCSQKYFICVRLLIMYLQHLYHRFNNIIQQNHIASKFSTDFPLFCVKFDYITRSDEQPSAPQLKLNETVHSSECIWQYVWQPSYHALQILLMLLYFEMKK